MRLVCFALALLQTSLLPAIELPLEQKALLEKAIKANDASLYEEAIALYTQILDEWDEDSLAEEAFANDLAYRIACAKYELGLWDDITDSFEPTANPGQILLALAYKNAGHPDKAIVLLQPLKEKGALSYEGLWQLGHALYQTGDKKAAVAVFSKFELEQTQPRLYYLAQLYLARMELESKQMDASLTRLQKLSSILPSDDSLRFELQFLMGESLYQLGHCQAAASHFEQALPKEQLDVDWRKSTMQRLASCYLGMADQAISSDEHLTKAWAIIQSLQKSGLDENTSLATARYYSVRARRFGDSEARIQADSLLSQSGVFTSPEVVAQVLLLKAEAAGSHQERDVILRQLTELARPESKAYAQSWYYRAVNDMETEQFDSASRNFLRAFELLAGIDPVIAGRSAKLAAQCYARVDTDRSLQEASTLLKRVIADHTAVIDASEDPDEFLYLLARSTNDDQYLTTALQRYPNGRFADKALYLLGINSYQQNNYTVAKGYFEQLSTEYPASALAGDAYYWQARCMGQDGDAYKELLKVAFTKYPDSTMAGEAYFSYYTPREYLQGNAEALQHLEAMPPKFPNSPFIIQAHLLTGLDYKRTRLSPEGRVLRKRNWIKAIESFEGAEAAFDRLHKQKHIPAQELDLFISVRYRAILERALANLAIATDSEGAKKHIYLEYAVEMFEKLVDELQNPQHPLGAIATQGESFSPLLEEASYHLAIAHIQMGDDTSAKKVLDGMQVRYQTAKVTRGYYLSRVWYQQARIAMRVGSHGDALQRLSHSEEVAKGKVLSAEEKLDLWLQRSDCFRCLGQLDNAMLELSRVINDDAISGQRLQAMYLRAEIYELQGRPELAQKQLIALAQKAGPWALTAKEKLDRDYHYE
ncbi:MAG: tetratricopeptide repeat protein [Chlamydiales bacterium]|nr:tetratricopeptide repeat protein [Chlamydiales bacterium]